MANTGNKVSQLPTASNVASTDRVMVLRDPSGNASVRTVPFLNFSANLIVSNTIPSTSSANGIAGEIAYDSTHFYICTANSAWKRITLETF